MSGYGKQRQKVVIVQGAQYGSEAKGMVAARLCKDRGIDFAVRTGCINAGHTVYYQGKGQDKPVPYAMQQLPTGWVNPGTALVLGAGAYIHVDTLDRECEMVAGALGVPVQQFINTRLAIDFNAGLHSRTAHEDSERSGRHVRIGATGKGSSEAIMSRIKNRGLGSGLLFKDVEGTATKYKYGAVLCDTSKLLNQAYDGGCSILLEGTQGHGLDLLWGPYPYTTHKPCNASQWIVEAGLAPRLEYETVLVARTMPIRVAGNSGPMERETGWYQLICKMNLQRQEAGMEVLVNYEALEEWNDNLIKYADAASKNSAWPGFPSQRQHMMVGEERVKWAVALSECNMWAYQKMSEEGKAEIKKVMEMTTVTKKPRRIGEWDRGLMQRSVMMNRPDWVALTFLNYDRPELWESTNEGDCLDAAMKFRDDCGAPINLVSTGPNTLVDTNNIRA